MVRTNKNERKILMPLLKGLDYLNVGILETKEADYNFGIERITNWLKKNQDFFTKFYNEINEITN